MLIASNAGGCAILPAPARDRKTSDGSAVVAHVTTEVGMRRGEYGRAAVGPVLLVRDAAAAAADPHLPARDGVPPGALDAAVRWLCRTHEATGRQGSSKGFSLVRGWLPAYPETTGYVIGTLLEAAARGGAAELVERAREMADWETALQQPDGGVMEGAVGDGPRPSIVFNTGMVLHGWMDLLDRDEERYAEPASRAAEFLVNNLRPDGTWPAEVEYRGLPHTYNSRVAWAMIRWAQRAGDEGALAAAVRHLDWVLSAALERTPPGRALGLRLSPDVGWAPLVGAPGLDSRSAPAYGRRRRSSRGSRR